MLTVTNPEHANISRLYPELVNKAVGIGGFSKRHTYYTNYNESIQVIFKADLFPLCLQYN